MDNPTVIHSQILCACFCLTAGSGCPSHPQKPNTTRKIKANMHTARNAQVKDARNAAIDRIPNMPTTAQRSTLAVFTNREITDRRSIPPQKTAITRIRDICASPSSLAKSRSAPGRRRYSSITAFSQERIIWRTTPETYLFCRDRDFSLSIIAPPVPTIVQGVSFKRADRILTSFFPFLAAPRWR